jgi:inosine triphosphate pyrophosphatase
MILITSSQGKLREFQRFFPDMACFALDVPEIQSLNAAAIIEAKIAAAGSAMQRPHDQTIVVEDTSLYVNSMNGLPGPLIKWFLEALGVGGLHDLITSYACDNRAVARTVIGYAETGQPIRYFSGETNGRIVAPEATPTFGWDNIFLPDGADETFAEMEPEEKDRWSMRGKAIRALQEYLK